MGDIHPSVRVEDGKFVVYFSNNAKGYHDGTTSNEIFKTILDKDGKIITERQRIENYPPIRPPHVDPKSGKFVDELVELALKSPGKNLEKDSDTIHSTFTHNGETAEVLSFDELMPWQVGQIDEKAIVAGVIVLAASPKIPDEMYMRWPLEFHSYDLETTRHLHSVRIGVPERIYSFPLVSNIVAHGDHAYMASMDRSRKGNSLQLSRFNPRTGEISNKRVSWGAGNSRPSIGVIGEKMLIAFHVPIFRRDADVPTLKAEIIYQHLDLSEFFKRRANPWNFMRESLNDCWFWTPDLAE